MALGVASSASVSVSRGLEMSQFWQNRRPRWPCQKTPPATWQEMVQRLLLDRVHAVAAGAPVGRQDDRALLTHPHKAKPPLPLLQTAGPRAHIAPGPPILGAVPVPRRHRETVHRSPPPNTTSGPWRHVAIPPRRQASAAGRQPVPAHAGEGRTPVYARKIRRVPRGHRLGSGQDGGRSDLGIRYPAARRLPPSGLPRHRGRGRSLAGRCPAPCGQGRARCRRPRCGGRPRTARRPPRGRRGPG
jgi:hypothetical protein